MSNRPLGKCSAGVFVVAALISLSAGRLGAQDPQTQMILERLDRIEKENAALKKTVQSQDEQLQRQQQLLQQLAPPASLPEGGVEASTAPVADKDLVKTAVDLYLEEKEKSKKEAEKKVETSKSWDVGAIRKVEGTWNNGLTFETPDKAFRFTVGGVTQFDMGWYGVDKAENRSIGTFNNYIDPNLGLQDGMDFRRARLRLSGVAFEQIEFFAQYEFANGIDLRQRTLGIANSAGVANPVLTNFDPAETTGFNEVYIGVVKVPVVGNIRVGRHRESLNFVTATADNNQIWMERGLLFEAFNSNNNFSNGVTVARNYLDGRAYLLLGVFMQNPSSNRQFATVGDGLYVYDARLTCLPIWEETGQLWAHVGVDYSYRNLSMDSVRYRARPDIRVGSGFQVPNLVDSGTIFSRDAQQVLNLEFASACGPWTFAAEGTLSWVTNAFTGGLPQPNGRLPAGVTPRGNYMTQGAYAEVMYFLTPDHRPYVKERPGYGRVSPRNNFFCIEGDDNHCAWSWGAWEVGARWDYVDLTNSGINGGTCQGITGAVNWYLSSNTRIQANYSWMYRGFSPSDNAGRVNGDINGFGLRFNCDY